MPGPSAFNEVLVFLKDPIHRYISAVRQLALKGDRGLDAVADFYRKEPNGLWTAGLDPHFWPQSWYVWEMEEYPLVFETERVENWLERHLIPYTEGKRRNTSTPEERQAVVEVLPLDIEDRVREWYRDDLVLWTHATT